MDKNHVSVPEDFKYYDKYQDRTASFSPQPDELVLTMPPASETETAGVSEAKIRSASESGSLNGVSRLNLERGVAVVKVDSEADSIAVTRIGVPADFTNAIPAFKDADGLTRYFLPDEITVQFNQEIDREEATRTISDLGSHVVIEQRTPGYYTIAVPENKDIFEAVRLFNEQPSVMFAEPSEIGFDDAQAPRPNDSRFGELWGLQNTGQTVEGVAGRAGIDVRVLDAWTTTSGDPDVVVVVIDTGMDMSHPDLAGNLVERNGEDWDFAAPDGSPDDNGSHGTHVCGTAAAIADNGPGICGVAPKCRLLPLRINLSAGMNANRADAINFASGKAEASPAQRYVINCSWRASGNFTAILFAIDQAVARGAIVIFAAGNAGRDMDTDPPQYPGVHRNAICVAALNSRGERASFSNVGSQVDVNAPGVDILSCIPSSDHDFKSGTSMAAPHVAGVCALIWSARKSLSNQEVRQLLEDNCDDMSAENPGLDGKLGRGRVNAERALQAVMALS
ncbi:S8 family serine peptidase [Acuticoccus sp. MNP-M23]|uniref:S8 family peptidase n=1 Tax=Acuticoccus sp. MNP-M23 TaxID=3072793 RepID=UPI0028158209|nr:S8 family serine peptidase [Acuticoccus sp. MNP-M23]WMS44499.1 S8 family serine peptidase [Acuticoccus sp. MNP-M23]